MKNARPSKKEIRDVLLVAGLIIYLIISISLMYRNNILLTALIVAGCTMSFWLWHQKEDIYCFVIAMILCPVGEIIFIHFGAYVYSNPSFLGIPIWLIPLYGLVVLLVRRLAYPVINL